MYSLIFGRNFVASAKKLEKRIKIKLEKSLELFRREPFHPTLHPKPLTGKLTGFYSFRITRDYRVIFQFGKNKTIILLRVKHRKDIYRHFS